MIQKLWIHLRQQVDANLPILNRFLTVSLILTIIGVGVFWVILQRENDVRSTKFANPEKLSSESDSVEALKPTTASRVKEMMTSVFTEEELTLSENQQLLQILDSSQFQNFLETNPNTLGNFFHFFQSQGIETEKNAVFEKFHQKFKQQFPAETVASIEHQMRQMLSNLLAESGLGAETAGNREDTEKFDQVLETFLSESENVTWMMNHFQGDYMAFGHWVMDVLQNPAPVFPVTSPFVDMNDVSSPMPKGSSGPEGTYTPAIVPQEDAPIPSTERPAVFELKVPGQSDFEAENTAPSTVEIPELPELPSEEHLKTALSEQFSVERFNRAIQTLNRYGPKEGLRRLKVSDPEAATRIESILLSPQENK
ncbi:hypothetical protein F4X10_18585 [Candidatus Poribacteria bacterium]|nr:hypothetical protein [Candidatus Poribacteria bacterium]